MTVIGIIPARLASSRFPEKVLAAATGRPLIQHVFEAASRAARLERLVIAADDPRVVEAARAFGAPCVLTRVDHANGTSRLAEAADLLQLPEDAVIVNVQGDEPELEPALLDAAVDALRGTGRRMATVAVPLADVDAADRNVVKVVARSVGAGWFEALYFSRSPIPCIRDESSRAARAAILPAGAPALRHVGLYAYTRDFLRTYAGLTPTPLEQAESLEQLRVLEHGHALALAVVAAPAPAGIDTPEQYAAFVARWRMRHG